MTDEQLDQLMRRVEAGDEEAQALIDDWIEQALGTAVPALETGARGGTRTRTLFQAADFKSATSTGFVTRAGCPA